MEIRKQESNTKPEDNCHQSNRFVRQIFLLLFGALCMLPVFHGKSDVFKWNKKANESTRFAQLNPPSNSTSDSDISASAGFESIDAKVSGIDFRNELNEVTVAVNRIYENGSGVAIGDVDGDGWPDVYLCGLETDNRLYRNLGDWKFEDITESAGVACEDQYSSGATLVDLDGDGDLDLLVNGIGSGTRLFINQGQGRFQEKTNSGLHTSGGASSMALADVDMDGDLDLYVTYYRTDTVKNSPPDLKVQVKMENGKPVVSPADRFVAVEKPEQGGVMLVELGEPDWFYLNDGSGNFEAIDWTAGRFLDEDGVALKETPRDWGLSVMFRDMNQDGLPDIYVCNDFYYSEDRIWLSVSPGKWRAVGEDVFRKLSMSSMALDFADINRDGLEDLLVVDMLSRDPVMRQIQQANSDYSRMDISQSQFVTRPQVSRNTLFLNRGKGTYSEIANQSGVEASGWSWGVVFLDVDLDGYEDILITNGHGHNVTDSDALDRLSKILQPSSIRGKVELLREFGPLKMKNVAFRNRGDLTFEDAGQEWGWDHEGISHGMALGDLDLDGDQDIVVNNYNEAAKIYRNLSQAPRVAVQLKGPAKNTSGIGTRIEVKFDGEDTAQSQVMIAGGRYLSSDMPVRTFAWNHSPTEDDPAKGHPHAVIEAYWPDGRVTRAYGDFKNTWVELDHSNSIGEMILDAMDDLAEELGNPDTDIEKEERVVSETNETGENVIRIRQPRKLRNEAQYPLFKDVSSQLAWTHVDQPFDDEKRQPLIPHSLSDLGPGLAWTDFDRDGWDDLIIGGGQGGALGIFRNNQGQSFWKVNGPPLDREITSILGWAPTPGESYLMVGSSNYEDGRVEDAWVKAYDLRNQRINRVLPAGASSAGPMAMADVDGDGDLDLFVGGRAIPGRYPEAASSALYLQENKQFSEDTLNSILFMDIGMVSSVLFTDWDGDMDPDLVLAGEWGPIRLFRNDDGIFSEATFEMGLGNTVGWWNSVTSGDWNGDGLLDLALGNWGRNHRYHQALTDWVGIYYGDINNDGTIDILEAYQDQVTGKVLPYRDRQTISEALPLTGIRFESYREFGEASVEEILGDSFNNVQSMQVQVLDSVILWNRGDRFEIQSMPDEVQFSPVFGMVTSDFDGDGQDDLLVVQNFFETPWDQARFDAGPGTLILNAGEEKWKTLQPGQAGINISGQARAAGVSDFNMDGRPDVAITQHEGEALLYQNSGASQGVTVFVLNADGLQAIGAKVRLLYDDETVGPVREIQMGGGYWTQNSAALTFGKKFNVFTRGIQVQWPDGAESEFEFSYRTKAVSVDALDRIKILK